MKLTNEELKRFDEDGYLFFPGKFTPEEAAMLKQEAEAVYALDREEVWRESNGIARTAFAAHKYNEGFRRLGAHPRMIEPVEQVLDGKVYMHQYKVNAKAAFDGDVWQWHQDYGTWKRDDDMPEPRAMNIAVFLDDVTAANGPLLFIPGSHKLGVVEGHGVGGARRMRRADGPGGQHADVLVAAGSCQPAEHFAVRADHRLSVALPRR